MSVFVDSTGADGQLFHDEGKTVEIAARGGVIIVAREFKVGQAVLVVNPKTWGRIACDVLSVELDSSSVNRIDVAFRNKSLSFWGITFSDPAEQTAAPESFADSTAQGLSGGNLGITKLVFRNRTSLVWIGCALIGLLLLLSFFLGARLHGPTAPPTPLSDAGSALQDVPPEDARLIPDLGSYRLATSNDFDRNAASSLQQFGEQPAGLIPGAYSGSNESNAYILVGRENAHRVVIVANGHLRWDAQYKSIVLAARVPKGALPRIVWADTNRSSSDGDGLLIVSDLNDSRSGVVLLINADQVITRTPVDFRLIYSSQIP
jgi:hypothetical protein